MDIIISIVVIIIILAVAGFIIYNLLKKVEIYEEAIIIKDEYIVKIKQYIQETDQILQDPKIRMGFENDDEIGQYFQKMKDVQLLLSGYVTMNTEGEKK